jgi:hypothetical protein
MRAWAEILGSVGLAIAAEPIHEVGHAVAARVLTETWPQVGFWAVHPTSGFGSKLDALIVLAAGDLAVLAWWAAIFLVIRRRPALKWALIGPSFMTTIVLLNWIAPALLTPFGRTELGASDAAKFLAISGVAPSALACRRNDHHRRCTPGRPIFTALDPSATV